MPNTTASPAFSNSPIVERNRLASWDGGVWASAANRAGWGQNTKEYDPAAQLTYMYQRWYDPALGVFTSTAPYPPMIEHPYGFAEGNPVSFVDPDGEISKKDIVAIIISIAATIGGSGDVGPGGPTMKGPRQPPPQVQVDNDRRRRRPPPPGGGKGGAGAAIIIVGGTLIQNTVINPITNRRPQGPPPGTAGAYWGKQGEWADFIMGF